MPAIPDPTTRAPASVLRSTTETITAGMPLAILVQYGITSVFPAVPPEVQVAAAAVALGLLNGLFTRLRDAGRGGWFTGAKPPA